MASARAAIAEGRVLVGGAPAPKPTRLVAPGEAVVVQGPPPRYVGRAGEKLHAALEAFAVAPEGRAALDVGSSTGGFTDCLLQHGAASVLAVDVGRNQLHERLRADPRVTVRERTDVRSLPVPALPGGAAVVTVDVSFISLRTVLPAVVAQAAPGADVVLLVKPQFEADRAVVSRGRGVVRDPAVWAEALRGVVRTLHDLGAAIMGAMVSPLHGADGNVELLVHALAPGHGRSDPGTVDVEGLVATAAGPA
ncbi:TlyA family RNA methyltransferase [Iamia majanohamensis]|uniref:TlyA family RNA methyltransferase n=1 Tax=Iamia majanohamensis TaxID=467976 RepID=UPI003AF2E1C5